MGPAPVAGPGKLEAPERQLTFDADLANVLEGARDPRLKRFFFTGQPTYSARL